MTSEHSGAVVVGLGGHRGESAPELDWAAREAQSRNRALHILRVHDPGEIRLPWDDELAPDVLAAVRSDEQDRVEAAVARARHAVPGLDVQGEVVDGTAADVLCTASMRAEVTVLGSRRLGPWNAAVLGSVSAAVAAHGSGPVVVVGSPAGDPAAHPQVVVGIDGSSDTEALLAFAFDYASRHGRQLHAVYCWTPDLLATMQWRPEPPVPERADRWLAEALAGWQERYPDVVTHRGVVRDFAVAGLVGASSSQELLVVGSHARHARLGTLLGSVSQGVLHHAGCPVAVVHARPGATGSAG